MHAQRVLSYQANTFVFLPKRIFFNPDMTNYQGCEGDRGRGKMPYP